MTSARRCPASVIVAGTDRSMLPGPSVMTNICPMPTITRKGGKGQRGLAERRRCWRRRWPAMVTSQTADAPRQRTRARVCARSAVIAPPPRSSRFRTRRSARTTIRIAPCAPICQSGGSLQEGQERARQHQRQRADHRADRRDPAAGELAAAEDDARRSTEACSAARCWRRPMSSARPAPCLPATAKSRPQRIGRRPGAQHRPAGPRDRALVAADPADQHAEGRPHDRADARRPRSATLATMRHRQKRRLQPSSALATQSGAVPPGRGQDQHGEPAQTKLMPSVTTMEGRSRR